MALSIVPKQIAEHLKFDISDSCRCCVTIIDRPVYITEQAEVKTISKKNLSKSTNDLSLQRAESQIRGKLANYSDDVDLHFHRLQELAKINFQLMQAHDIPLTSKRIEKINEAIDKLAIELGDVLKTSPDSSPHLKV